MTMPLIRTLRTLGVLLLLIAAQSGHGQNFDLVPNKCSGCHASPPDVAATSPSGMDSVVIGLSEGWLTSNPADLKARLEGARYFGSPISAMMTVAASNSDLTTVYNYLFHLREAQAALTAPSFPQSTAVGSTTTRATTFTLTNYRASALTFSFTSSNPRFTASSASSSCPAATSGTAPTACLVNVTIAFSPTAADVTAPQTSVTLNSDITVQFTYPNSEPQPTNTSVTQSIRVTATAYRPTPAMTLAPAAGSTLAFTARASANASDTRTLTITNGASATASLVNVRLGLGGSPPFTLSTSGVVTPCSSTTGPFTLLPNSSCNLGVVFTPQQAGSSSGTLTVTADNAASASLTLSGTGTQSIATIPTTLAFGEVKKDAFKDLPLTISNGSGSSPATAPLNFTPPPQLQGAAAGDYTVTANTCTTPVSQVSPNNTCTITVRFRPTTSDGSARPATLTLQTDAANLVGGTATIALTGTGTAQPAPTLSAQALTFADTVLGETSPSASLTITNPRTDTLTYALTLPAEFVEDTPACANRAIPASGTCTISLRLRPLAASGAGPRNASVPVSFTVPAGQTAPANLPLTLAGTALWPLSASPTTLSPSTTIGATTLPATTLSNRSIGPVTLGSVTFSGSASADYTVDSTSGCRTGVSLPAGQGCTLVLRYTPTQPGARTASLAITHNAVAGSPLVLTLNGSVEIGQVSLSASSMAFADTTLGSPASPASLITLRNTGSAPLTLSSLSLGGSHPGDFTRGGTCQASGVLAIGAECTVSLQFQPSALGNRAATLSIAHTGSAPSPVVLTLSGQGTAQPVGLLLIDGDNPLDFGRQTLNGLYDPRPVRLRNTGTASLQITGLTLGGSGFSLVDNPACTVGTTLAIGQSCDLGVRFSPPLADTDYRATLTIAHSAGAPQAVTFVGRGTAAVVPVLTWVDTPAALDFGQQTVGTASTTTRTLSLRNQGPGAVLLSLVNAIGLDAAMFPVQGGSGDSGACSAGLQLAQGLSCTVTLSFSPGSPGAHAARLQVLSSGTTLAPLPLVGTGLGPVTDTPLTLSTSHLGFGATRTGSASLPMEVLLQAGSLAAVQVVGWAVEGPFLVENRSCPPLPFTLAAGSQCAVVVRFLPGVAGEATGTLQVTSSETSSTDGSGTSSTPTASVRRVALSGQGQASADVVDGGGGCSMARPGHPGRIDPVLPLLAIVALWVLWWRRSLRHGR